MTDDGSGGDGDDGSGDGDDRRRLLGDSRRRERNELVLVRRRE